MDYSNRRWVIISVSDITDEMISSAIQTSRGTLRKSLDGSKAILKFEGRKPTCFNGIDTYNHSQILTELRKEEWRGSGE